MGASLGQRQGPKHAQASSAGVVLSLPGRDGSNAAAEPRRLRLGRKKFRKGTPPTPNPVTLESLRVSSGCCPSGDWVFSTRTSATCRSLGTLGSSFAPPSLVSSVRKGEIGAVTERLGQWAQSVGHHFGAGNGGGGEASADPPAPVSKSLPS